MLRKIWERYFLQELIKSTLFFLVTFYALYVLLDYASNAASLHRHHTAFNWRETLSYYGFDFANRLEVLLPFALLLATIHTLCTLNKHNELVALLTCGIGLKQLLKPFILFGLFCTALMYFNTEWITPTALKHLRHIHDQRSSKKQKYDISAVQHIVLEDGSTIIFQTYDSSLNLFFDNYWIRTIDDIYRIKYLRPSSAETQPLGYYVDRLVRNADDELVVVESYETKSFPEIHFNKETLFETLTPPEEHSLSTLWTKHPIAPESDKEAQLQAEFYRKLILPWLCFLAVIGPAPFCIFFTRNLHTFLIYSGAIFGLVAFYILMGAVSVLGKRQVFPPLFVMWPPFILLMSFFSWRFFKLR